MTQRKRSTSAQDFLKAERVQRGDAATDVTRLKAERVQLRAYLAPPPGWRRETAERLTRTFEYVHAAAAMEATRAARELARGWNSAPRIRRAGKKLTVTFTAPPGESLRDVDLLRAALLEEHCGRSG